MTIWDIEERAKALYLEIVHGYSVIPWKHHFNSPRIYNNLDRDVNDLTDSHSSSLASQVSELTSEYESAVSLIDELYERNDFLESVVGDLSDVIFESLDEDERDVYMCAATLEILNIVHRQLNNKSFKFK